MKAVNLGSDTEELTRVVEKEPEKLVSDEVVNEVANAKSQQDAQDLVLETGVVIGTITTSPNPEIFKQLIPSPEAMQNMSRVAIKRHFAASGQKMFELGTEHNDPLLTLLGANSLFLANTVMKVSTGDHIKDALESFAKKAGAVCLAAAAAVAAIAAAAAKKIGELWDKTKPLRDKIKQTLKDMAKKIAEVTKPAREAIKAAAIKAGTEIGKAGNYIAEKTKAAGKAISKKAHAAGEYLASTAPGKAIMKAGRDARGKITAVTAAASAAIGAKLVAKGAKMQEKQAKYEKAAKTVKSIRTATQTAKKLRETLKSQGVSLETRQQAAPYAAGAKPRDRGQGK